MNYDEVRDVVKKFYAGFTASFAEMVKSISIPPRKLDEKLTFIGLERLTGLVEEGRNVIACLGHCGNWEVLNYLPAKIDCDMYAVYKPLKSETADRLIRKLRSRFWMKLLANWSVAKHILKVNHQPSVYLFLSDQRPVIKNEQYRVDLLNQPTYHCSGMEKVARTSRSAVVYLHILPQAKGPYFIICSPLCVNASTTCEGEITRRYILKLAANIEEVPHCWLWSHKRWKN